MGGSKTTVLVGTDTNNKVVILKQQFTENNGYDINTFDDLIKHDKKIRQKTKKEKKTINKLHKNKK